MFVKVSRSPAVPASSLLHNILARLWRTTLMGLIFALACKALAVCTSGYLTPRAYLRPLFWTAWSLRRAEREQVFSGTHGYISWGLTNVCRRYLRSLVAISQTLNSRFSTLLAFLVLLFT